MISNISPYHPTSMKTCSKKLWEKPIDPLARVPLHAWKESAQWREAEFRSHTRRLVWNFLILSSEWSRKWSFLASLPFFGKWKSINLEFQIVQISLEAHQNSVCWLPGKIPILEIQLTIVKPVLAVISSTTSSWNFKAWNFPMTPRHKSASMSVGSPREHFIDALFPLVHELHWLCKPSEFKKKTSSSSSSSSSLDPCTSRSVANHMDQK